MANLYAELIAAKYLPEYEAARKERAESYRPAHYIQRELGAWEASFSEALGQEVRLEVAVGVITAHAALRVHLPNHTETRTIHNPDFGTEQAAQLKAQEEMWGLLEGLAEKHPPTPPPEPLDFEPDERLFADYDPEAGF